MKRLFAPVLMVGVLSACEQDNEKVERAEAASRHDEERIVGVYEVPTTAELSYAASNPVAVRIRTRREGAFRLKYDLPTVIAGYDRDVDFTVERQSDGTWSMSGAAGTGTCVEARGDFVCQEELRGLTMSALEAREAISRLDLSAEERAARIQIADEFAVDPLGIVRFRSLR